MSYWERFSNGLRMALTSTKIITLDELRLTADAVQVFEMEYFTGMLVPWLKYVTRGVVTEAEFSKN